MSGPSASPPVRKAGERLDKEFLPAALEILETPPSPIRMALLLLICAFAVVALLWSWFGTIDIVATAQGKIQPPGRVKVIQPLETGKVAAFRVTNGTRVEEGDVLVELDPRDASADAETLRLSVASAQAEIRRRDAAIRLVQKAAGEAGGLSALGRKVPEPLWDNDSPAPIRQREQDVLEADIAQLSAQIGALEAQARQKEAERARLNNVVAAQRELVTTLRERVDMRNSLASSGSGTRASLLDARELLQTQQTQLVNQLAQIEEITASLVLLSRERDRAVQTFLTDHTQRRRDASRLLDELQQRLAKAKTRLANLTLKAPVSGVVLASTVYTVGQVVTAGQELMRVIPTSDTLEVEAYLPNKDIGFIAPGQPATVKIDSFPFTRYGAVTGRVLSLARDAIPHSEIGQIEGDPTRATESRTFAGAQRVQNLVFPMIVALDTTVLGSEGQAVPLSSGMTVTVEVTTGRRRILSYLLSPVLETTSQAMRER